MVYAWEQQDGEPDNQFLWFLAYLRMERGERSVTDAFYKFHNIEDRESSDEKPNSYWFEVSRTWKWKQRALEYDRRQDRIALRKLEARRFASLVEVAELGETLRKRATAAAKLLSPVTRSLGMHDGREVVVMEVALSPDQIVKLADVGVKLEQLALGNPTAREVVEEQPSSDLSNAKDKLRQKLDEIRSRRAAANAQVATEDESPER